MIAAVLFEDGSFEGDPDVAAGMAAHWAAESLQFSRLVQLMQAAETSDQDESATLAKLKAEMETLKDDADPAMASKLLARFPGVSEDMRKRRLAAELTVGMKSAKFNLRNDIQRFEYQRTHNPAAKDIRTWLTEVSARYERFHSPY